MSFHGELKLESLTEQSRESLYRRNNCSLLLDNWVNSRAMHVKEIECGWPIINSSKMVGPLLTLVDSSVVVSLGPPQLSLAYHYHALWWPVDSWAFQDLPPLTEQRTASFFWRCGPVRFYSWGPEKMQQVREQRWGSRPRCYVLCWEVVIGFSLQDPIRCPACLSLVKWFLIVTLSKLLLHV